VRGDTRARRAASSVVKNRASKDVPPRSSPGEHAADEANAYFITGHADESKEFD
jgi:hypothetical protein